MGVPATGKPVKFTKMAFLTVKDGKITSSWYNVDMMTIMQQIGAIPGPGG
jgi:predicted ester cyclase